jgi:hypothetical protein
MTLEEAIIAARDAIDRWSQYLSENDREDECRRYDAAADTLAAFTRLIVRGSS